MPASSGCDSGKSQCKVDDDCAKMQCDPGEVPACMANECGCIPDIAPGDVGRFSSMTLIDNSAYVAAYNNTYGDLMIGHITPPGVVSGWDFVDGVPDEAPDIANSHNRGGISDKGDDVINDVKQRVDRLRENIDGALTDVGAKGRMALDNAKDNINDFSDTLEESIRERPFTVLAIALGLGVIVGSTLRR